MRNGQSLMDILVGVALGVIFIFAAVSAIGPALNTSSQASRTQTAAWLASGLLSNLQTWANGDWHPVLLLATGTANHYFLITSSSPYTATSGIETVLNATTSYWRYFYISDVYRDSGGNIVTSGGSYDPSTKLATVAYGWNGGTTSTASEYLTRNQQQVYSQIDWSGGTAPSSTSVSTTNFQFTSSSNINYASPGSIQVNTL